MDAPQYVCAVCGAPVKVEDERLVRACEHDGGAVVAAMNAKVVGEGGFRDD